MLYALAEISWSSVLLRVLAVGAVGVVVCIGGAIYFAIRNRGSHKLPIQTIERVKHYTEWMELDVIQRKKIQEQMTQEERAELRASELAHAEHSRKLPEEIEELEELIQSRRRVERGVEQAMKAFGRDGTTEDQEQAMKAFEKDSFDSESPA